MSDNGDPYKYPGLDVLKNKRDIRDAATLQKFEYRRSALRELELIQTPIQGNFDLEHLKAIHKHLFQDVYEWAGKERTVFISKGGSRFAHPDHIESYGALVHRELKGKNFLRGLEKEQFVEELSKHYAEVNALHPFREGNGRSTRTYIAQLSKEAGYELDYSKVDKERWNEAAKRSFNSDTQAIKEVFSIIATPSKAVAFDKEKPEVALKNHPSLKGAFLALKAAELYAAKIISDPQSREAFVSKTKEKIRETLGQGKDVAAPETVDRGRGFSR